MQQSKNTLEPDSDCFLEELFPELVRARQVVYQVHPPTPQQTYDFDGLSIVLKREDQSIIHSYKWRGSFFKMFSEVENGFAGTFVAASAGNHAQGVAFAAKKLQIKAIIFMPLTTPLLKQESVKKLGGKFVSVKLIGDSFDEAAAEASDFAKLNGSMIVPPFDDPHVIAGQSTVGLELLTEFPGLKKVYVPIGGGGLASGLILAKQFLDHPCEIVGVEVDGQDSMNQSVHHGSLQSLDRVDGFCDGTAVKRPGSLTFQICQRYLDRIITIDNQNAASAIRKCWDVGRFLPEPSGAISIAGLLKDQEGNKTEGQVAGITTGSNLDFKTFSRIARLSDSENPSRRYYKFQIPEANGSLIQLLDRFLSTTNIVDFQYGKTSLRDAAPILGFEGNQNELQNLERSFMDAKSLEWSPVFSSLSDFRIIPFRPDLCNDTLFLKTEFPNRSGALREFMREVSKDVNICYFNFSDSGESVGQVLVGFEPLHKDSVENLFEKLGQQKIPFQRYQQFQN